MFRFTAVLIIALSGAQAAGQMAGINLVLNVPQSPGVLAELASFGDVLDVYPEINAVTLRACPEDLGSIAALPFVAAANVDSECTLEAAAEAGVPDFSNGTSMWNLDAINVTDFGATRTVPYDGDGIFIAVIDSGLPQNWREYFPEDRIASQFAISFRGGGGEHGNIPAPPQDWEHDTFGHGTKVVSALLGFSYYESQFFNGVAPRATVIPIRTFRKNGSSWSSVNTHAILHAASLKTSGALGAAPLVMNLSFGGLPDAMQRAAIDYAIAQGIVVVAGGGNQGASGMIYPAGYPEVISTAAAGWAGQFPDDDPTRIWWLLRDVPEVDPLEYYIAPFSSHELPGQDLDVAAPGDTIPTAWTRAGQADYTFWGGNSAAGPHVTGIAALMLQKNPNLTQATVEAILEATAMPLGTGCRATHYVGLEPGNAPTFSDLSNAFFFPTTFCFGANATGHGLVQADAALNATPMP